MSRLKRFLLLLKENQTPTYIEVMQLISHVSEMERRMSDMLEELKSMRQEMKSAQNPSLRATLQKSYKALEERVEVLRQRIFKLKNHIVEESKHILDDFKTRGIIALNGVIRFLQLKPALEAIQTAAENGVETSNRAISRINDFSTEYHETGRHLKKHEALSAWGTHNFRGKRKWQNCRRFYGCDSCGTLLYTCYSTKR